MIALLGLLIGFLPCLESDKDFKYVKDSLFLNVTEDQAKENFQKKIKEALKNHWKVDMNFAFHNLAKK